MQNQDLISVYVKVFVGQTKDGKPFDYYKLVDKHGKFTDLRFTRKVTNRPTEDSLIKVRKSDINYDKNRLYPCYWVKNIVSMKTIAQINEEQDQRIFGQRNEEQLNDIMIDDDNLPF